MSDNQQTPDHRKASADIDALVRAALESADPVVMRHDLEMILTITEEALQPRPSQFRRIISMAVPASRGAADSRPTCHGVRV